MRKPGASDVGKQGALCNKNKRKNRNADNEIREVFVENKV